MPRVHPVTRSFLRHFLQDLPWVLGVWLLVLVLPPAFLVIFGEMTLREAAGAAVAFLPLAVPLSPLIWLR